VSTGARDEAVTQEVAVAKVETVPRERVGAAERAWQWIDAGDAPRYTRTR
jgi:hypothetical protein